MSRLRPQRLMNLNQRMMLKKHRIHFQSPTQASMCRPQKQIVQRLKAGQMPRLKYLRQRQGLKHSQKRMSQTQLSCLNPLQWFVQYRNLNWSFLPKTENYC
ncbi:hypothetical protein L0F63_006522 [Massospora cicadina]|nr:hypothetical protein L0F63_006522 [Massospora cicadina]